MLSLGIMRINADTGYVWTCKRGSCEFTFHRGSSSFCVSNRYGSVAIEYNNGRWAFWRPSMERAAMKALRLGQRALQLAVEQESMEKRVAERIKLAQEPLVDAMLKSQ